MGADCARWLNKRSQFSVKVALIILEFKKTGGKLKFLPKPKKTFRSSIICFVAQICQGNNDGKVPHTIDPYTMPAEGGFVASLFCLAVMYINAQTWHWGVQIKP